MLLRVFTSLILLLALLSPATAQYEVPEGEMIFNLTGILAPNMAVDVNGEIIVPANKTGSAVIVTLTTSICADDGTNCTASPIGTSDGSTVKIQCYNAQNDTYGLFTSERSSNFQVVYITPNSPAYLVPGQDSPGFSCSISTADAPFILPIPGGYWPSPMNPKIIKFALEARLQESPVILSDNETAAAAALYDACCGDTYACTLWKTPRTSNDSSSTITGDKFTNLCQVPGNICNSNGSLVQLNLRGNNLTCAYPTSQLAGFSNLEYLYTGVGLDGTTNSMTGDFPTIATSIAASLPLLKEWDLSYNQGITGSISDSSGSSPLCTLTSKSLVQVRLALLGLTGALPDCLFAASSKLRYFYASATQISGAIPTSLGTNSPLQVFQVASAQLSGSLPATLSPNLVKFNVSGNALSGSTFPTVAANSLLTVLDLSANDLQGGFDTSILNYPTLYFVDIRGNSYSSLDSTWTMDQAPVNNANDSTLRYLMMGQNQFDAQFPVAAGYLGNLDMLDVDKTGTNGGLPELASPMFNSMRMLFAANNELSGVIPDSWQEAGIFAPTRPGPKIFDVTNNTLTGPIPSYFLQVAFTPPYIYLTGNNFNNSCDPNYIDLGACNDPTKYPPADASNTGGSATGSTSGLSSGAIAGIVIGTLLAVALVGFGVYKYRQKRKAAGPRQYQGRFERFDDDAAGQVEMGLSNGGQNASAGNVQSHSVNFDRTSAANVSGVSGSRPNPFAEP